MVRFFLITALCSLTLSSELCAWFFASDNVYHYKINKQEVKEYLKQLAILPPEEQAQLIQEAQPQLSSEALLALYDQAKENGLVFLKELLKAKFPSKETQQELINSLGQELTDSDLLRPPSDNLRSSVTETANPDYFATAPIAISEAPLSESFFASEPMMLLCKKIQAFETLIDKQEFEKAALVAEDIAFAIKNSDLSIFFPKLFTKYFALTATHIEALTQERENKNLLKWNAMQRLYQTDLNRFIEW